MSENQSQWAVCCEISATPIAKSLFSDLETAKRTAQLRVEEFPLLARSIKILKVNKL